MFILRSISSDGIVKHRELGNSYTYVGRVESPEHFRDFFKMSEGYDHVADLDPQSTPRTKAAIGVLAYSPDGLVTIYSDFEYYVMRPDGSTFAKL